MRIMPDIVFPTLVGVALALLLGVYFVGMLYLGGSGVGG
jgi:hypothetical protein